MREDTIMVPLEEYETLIRNVDQFKSGVTFTIADVIAFPNIHTGRKFRKEVDKGNIPNVEFISNERGVDEYRKL